MNTKTSTKIAAGVVSVATAFGVGIGLCLLLEKIGLHRSYIDFVGICCGFYIPNITYKWILKEESENK